MQSLRGVDKGRKMVKVWVCATQLLGLSVHVFFQVIKSHGQSLLRYIELTSAFFRVSAAYC